MENAEIIIKIIKLAYYIVAGLATFFAIFSVYILIKYAEKRVIAITASIILAIIFLGVLGNSYNSLININL